VNDKVHIPTARRAPAELGRYALGGRILGLLAAVALQACVPFPHREPVAPQIAGVVRGGASPLPGVTLQYTYSKSSDEPDCSRSDATTKTTSDGRFFFKQPTKFWFFMFLGDRGYAYDLCVTQAVGPILLWRNRDFARLSTPADLDCDLNAPVVEARMGKGRCNVKTLAGGR
jgi:hypothetical protein